MELDVWQTLVIVFIVTVGGFLTVTIFVVTCAGVQEFEAVSLMV